MEIPDSFNGKFDLSNPEVKNCYDRIKKAQEEWNDNNHDEAIKILNQTIHLYEYSDNIEVNALVLVALLIKGYILLDNREIEDAQKTLAHATNYGMETITIIDFDNKNEESLILDHINLKIASMLMNAEIYAEAIGYLNKTIESQINSNSDKEFATLKNHLKCEALQNKAISLLELNEPQQAIEACNFILNISNHKNEPLFILHRVVALDIKGDAYAYMQDFNSTIDCYKQLVENYKEYCCYEDIRDTVRSSWCKLGIALFSVGKIADGKKAIEQSIKMGYEPGKEILKLLNDLIKDSQQ